MFNIAPPEAISGQSAPLIYVAQLSMGDVGKVALVIAGTIAALSSVNTSIMAQSRVAYALSRDGYFPKAFQRIHHRFSTPHIAVVVGAIFTAVLAATGVINFVGYATDFGFIIGFALVNLSLMKLRREKPLLDRPFKTPLYPFTPIAGIATSLFLLIFIDVGVLSLGVVLSVLAVLAYYIRMVGYLRFRVAFGGISIGLGGFTALLTYLITTGSMPLNGVSEEVVTAIVFILFFASMIQIIAGILNVTAKSSTS
jgi:amino acid transporter